MAINPILPFVIGAIQTRNKIKDVNEAEYDDVTGQFIDLASSEFFKDQTDQKKRIEKNNNFFDATERRYGTNVAEFAAKSNLFDGYDKITAFLSDIEGGTVIPLGLRKELGTKEGFKKQAFKTTFAQDQSVAKQKLDNRADFAKKNLNKGAMSNLADLYLKGTDVKRPDEQGPVKEFLFGKKAPDATALVGGFTEGLEGAEEKAVTDIQTDGMSDAKELAQDTEIVTKKIGFETPIGIGSVREVDSAIASIFNVENVQITNEGIIFPEAFKLRALAIKEIASNLQQTGNYADVTTLISAAARQFEQQHFSKLPLAFGGVDGKQYKRTSNVGNPVVVNATGVNNPETNDMVLGAGFIKVFGSFADNPKTTDIKESLSYVDQILKPRRETGGTELLMSKNAYQAIKRYIDNMDTDGERKAFIQYLPDNYLSPFGKGETPLKIKNTLNATFGFTRI